jgi:5-methylcytosine-specific restriction endonuclease McrA
VNKRSKACDIGEEVKRRVFERDGRRCILCGSSNGKPNAHFVARSQGGLGIEQNIITLCPQCHFEYDNGKNRKGYKALISAYLERLYPNFAKRRYER